MKNQCFDQLGLPNSQLYNENVYPTSLENFLIINEYYEPFINAFEQYLAGIAL